MGIDTRILVYKQTILPLVEYVSFILCLSNKHEVEKMQKLQNRCLRMCFDINNSRNISVSRLHDIARVSKLDVRRDIQLCNIMHTLKCNGYYKKDGLRETRRTAKYVFKTDIVHTDIYAKSPYLKGVTLWNSLPQKIQTLYDKVNFKISVKGELRPKSTNFV